MTQNISLEDTLTATKHLLTWQDGWNGYDALAPKEEPVYRACHWIRTIHSLWPEQMEMPGGVTSDGEGSVVYEWWSEQSPFKHRLTVYIDRNPDDNCWILDMGPADENHAYLEGELTYNTWPAVWYAFCGVKLPLGNSENLYDPDLYYDLTRVPVRVEA